MGICRGDHPRIRGEHHLHAGGRLPRDGSSPHTRGARSSCTAPAVSLSAADHPRIRGEHAKLAAKTSVGPGSSPHTRGAPVGVEVVGEWTGIIPAYAGSTSRTRRQGCRQTRIIPAYAGSTGFSPSMSAAVGDHPRIRGEHRPVQPRPGGDAGSSPHTRGAPSGPPRLSGSSRIIPAYAGSTSIAWGRQILPWDHPRIRGEHLGVGDEDPHFVGSSPHTRGAPPWRQLVAERCGIIPAYAGSTGSWRGSVRAGWDHPRIRGEHPGGGWHWNWALGSSPHTRGARFPRGRQRRLRGIIPAYAGSTPGVEAGRPGKADHPRIRGEHRRRSGSLSEGPGSSPHTRGAQHVQQSPHRRQRIIPAYAGSTSPAAARRWPSADHPRIRGEHVKLSYM